jgi:IS4 transposase
LVDASVVCEPGATGSTWRLHYMIDLSTLRCEQAQVTLPEEGETLTRFAVQAGDVLMADRGLAHRRGIRSVTDHGADVVVRMNLVGVPLEDDQGRAFDVLSTVRPLAIGEVGSWRAWMRDERGLIAVRVCALRKTVAQTLKTQEKLRKTAARKNRQLQPETLEAAGYVLVLTTLIEVDAAAILELYRYRWQIELAFKRLKSLLQLGHLKKTDPEGAKAWLQGKLLVAALIEMLIAVGERFSPWGYFCHPA